MTNEFCPSKNLVNIHERPAGELATAEGGGIQPHAMGAETIAKAAGLRCWSGPVDPQPVAGGITNANYVVRDRGERFFVRIGDDIPLHGVWRWNELAASRAAYAAGISPRVVYAEPGALVLEFIEGTTLRADDLRQTDTLTRILPLLRKCHRDLAKYYDGPNLLFWVFAHVHRYAAALRAGCSRHAPSLGRLLAIAAELERTVGAVHIAFGHNDLLAANFLDDGKRLWLVDWDYAGFNSPLFDLGGLASNSELSHDLELWLLESYFETPVLPELWQQYAAMKCASLLRETLWSMVSEIHSTVSFDYSAYTEENLRRFEGAYAALQAARS
jgi:thiamine kinase-like enzyme